MFDISECYFLDLSNGLDLSFRCTLAFLTFWRLMFQDLILHFMAFSLSILTYQHNFCLSGQIDVLNLFISIQSLYIILGIGDTF